MRDNKPKSYKNIQIQQFINKFLLNKAVKKISIQKNNKTSLILIKDHKN